MLSVRWAAAFVLGAVVAGCGGDQPPATPAAPTPSGPAAESLADLIGGTTPGSASEIAGMTVAGRAPTLSWSSVPGASTYLVTARADEDTAWTWQGDELSVEFGEVSPTVDELTSAVGVPLRLDPAQAGKTYRWTVSAYDDADLLAEGEGAFSCTADGCAPVESGD